MKNWNVLALALVAASMSFGQQKTLTDTSISQLAKAGLSDDLILTTIASNPGDYDMAPEKLVELKKEGVSDAVLNAMMRKSNAGTVSAPAPTLVKVSQSQPTDPTPAPSVAVPVSANTPPTGTLNVPAPVANMPRVYLESKSKGNHWAAARDQSMEMGKDFDKNCPTVKITLAQNNADYTVYLSHIEVGFARDNQMQIADRSGDLIAHTKEGGGINIQVKKACADIMADWAKNAGATVAPAKTQK